MVTFRDIVKLRNQKRFRIGGIETTQLYEIKRLQEENKELKKENEELREEIDSLERREP